MLQRTIQIGSLLTIGLIVTLSLVPGTVRPHTGAPAELEHFIAYLAAGATLAIVFPRWRSRFLILLSAMAATLEMAQLQIPGRDPRLIGFVASAAGAATGVALGAWFSDRLLRLQSLWAKVLRR